MKIERIDWRPFRIPFRAPYVTGAGSVEFREVILVWLHIGDGWSGVGEASLLPEHGLDHLPEMAERVRIVARRLVGRGLEELPQLLDATDEPSQVAAAVACAFDTASLDAAGKAAGVPVARLLSDRVRGAVEINAMIGGMPQGMAVSEALAAREKGYRTIKLKVGIGTYVATEAWRVAATRSAIGPDALLRLDANGAWGVDDALLAIEAFAPYGIELIEQPVLGGLDALKAVRSRSVIPVAADEEVDNVNAVEQIAATKAADYVVVKPTRMGGLRAAHAAIERAAAAAVKAFVTTSIDTGIGTAAALHLAATLPEGAPACGLATAALLESDLLAHPLKIKQGQMALPSAPGLGIELSRPVMERYGGKTESV